MSQSNIKSNIQIRMYHIGVIRIQMNEFVSDIIQNIRIAMNEIIAAKIRIGTYLFIEKGQDTRIRLYQLESRLEN